MTQSWHNEQFRGDKVELDPYSNTEGVFVTGGCFSTIGAGCFVIGAIAEREPLYLAAVVGLGFIAAMFFLIYSKLRDTIELDFLQRLVRSKRRFGGWSVREDNVRFDFLHAAIVSPKSSRSGKNGPLTWSYGLAVVSEDGKLIKLTEENQSRFEVAEDAARRLAERIDCKLFVTEPAHLLKIASRFPPEISLIEHK